MLKRPNDVGKILSKNIIAIKNYAEKYLETKTDLVCFSKSTDKGITDLSFEKHESQKRVSLYFTTDEEGIKAYKRTAKMVCSFPDVELDFTPHFGQSRISFGWDGFWEKLDDSKFSFITPNTLLMLQTSDKDDIKNQNSSMSESDIT